MANEYKRGRSQGELGIRPTGKTIGLNDNRIVYQEYLGVASDDNDVWLTHFLSGKPAIVNETFGEEIRPAIRTNHPELGWIWYVDLDEVADYFIENNANAIFDSGLETVYFGNSGSIAGSGEGRRYLLADGRSLTTYLVLA